MTASRSAFAVRLGLMLTILALILASTQVLAQPAATFAPPPTNTPRGTLPTNTRTPSPTRTPTSTRTPTPTRTPSNTPTSPPAMVILGTYQTPVNTPVTPIPPQAATPVASGDDIVTILLLGSDTITPGVAARTDVVILVAIDRTANTVTMLHIPRDSFLYAPNYTMAKINTIMNYGDQKYGPGGGAKLLEDTIYYNFGIKVNFYAHIDFVQFEDLILKLGGLDISVDCAIQGHRLKSPELDVTKAENYELYTLPVGFHKLTPYMALWYVRSRGSSSDLNRGQRQLDVLRAMWREAKNAGLFAQLTTIWPEAQKIVNTDMTLQDVIGLVPTGLALDPTNIQRINIDLPTHFNQFYTGDLGEYALAPKPDAWKKTIQDFITPPTNNRLGGETPTVEIAAALPLKGYDQVAADSLSWLGFSTKALGWAGITNRDATVIYDYTGNTRPSSRDTLMKTLRVNKSNVIDKPDPNRTVDFRVEMGKDYGQCIYALPKEFQDLPPTPAPTKPK